jgi:arylsulfatase A-like enzyme
MMKQTNILIVTATSFCLLVQGAAIGASEEKAKPNGQKGAEQTEQTEQAEQRRVPIGADLPRDKPQRPNILFLLADQWRAQAVGYMGNRQVQTPNLDRLATESISFVNAVSGCPVCTPMRATMLTGQRPLTHGLFLNDLALDPAATSVAEVLGQHGYDTAYIGKWHVDGHGRSDFIPAERRQGFEYWKVLECTHAYNRSFYYADGPEKLQWQGYDANAQTEDARKYIRRHANGERPFVLFLAWGPPHAPYHTAPEEIRALYDAGKIAPRPNVIHYLREQSRKDLAGYYAHCTALDACVGSLRQTLDDAGIADDTILVFTSDHGDLIGAHGAWKKQQPYEESIRVPMLWHYPRVMGRKQRSLDALINSEDLMPTLLGMAGVPIPPSVEGLDFSRHIRGAEDPSDGAALLTCPMPFGQWAKKWGGREYRGIRTKRHTYVRDRRGPWLLFDNVEDPYQMNNLLGQQGSEELEQRLEAWLQRKLDATGDQFLPGMDYVRQRGYQVDATGTVRYRN